MTSEVEVNVVLVRMTPVEAGDGEWALKLVFDDGTELWCDQVFESQEDAITAMERWVAWKGLTAQAIN